MYKLKYVRFSEINPVNFVDLLNNQKIREHLVDHERFDINSIMGWINSKLEMDSKKGCRVRGILSSNLLAGWCGIQLEQGQYEIAIVINDKYWGIGRSVFNEVMAWAKDLGHDEIYIHFLNSRPEYKFLKKMSKTVFETEHFGEKFVTYKLLVK